jgi:uncharacterized protein YutE (UPF0331/DUF86 family)
MPSQQLQGQLQTQRSVDTGNHIMDKYKIKSKINYRELLEETKKTKQINKQTNEDERLQASHNTE